MRSTTSFWERNLRIVNLIVLTLFQIINIAGELTYKFGDAFLGSASMKEEETVTMQHKFLIE